MLHPFSPELIKTRMENGNAPMLRVNQLSFLSTLAKSYSLTSQTQRMQIPVDTTKKDVDVQQALGKQVVSLLNVRILVNMR